MMNYIVKGCYRLPSVRLSVCLSDGFLRFLCNCNPADRPTDRPQLSIACLPLNSIKMPRLSTGKCAELSILLLIVVEGGVSQRRQYSNYRGPSPNGPSGSISRVRPSRAAIYLSPIKGKVWAVSLFAAVILVPRYHH